MGSTVLRKLGAKARIASVLLASLVAMLALQPAAAQLGSEGYQFLKAVDDRDGDKATEMLNKPGTQIINTRDITSGDTGLHLVVRRNDTLWVRFLLQRGANPNIRNNAGVTPLQLATTLNMVEAVEVLIDKGAQVNVADQTGETPLMAAAHQRNIEIFRKLLEKGADPDRNDNSGRSARDYVNLMTGNSLLLRELATADAARAGNPAQQEYGPSF